MKRFEDTILEEMTKVMEKKQELELQLMIAEKEYAALQAAYRAYKKEAK